MLLVLLVLLLLAFIRICTCPFLWHVCQTKSWLWGVASVELTLFCLLTINYWIINHGDFQRSHINMKLVVNHAHCIHLRWARIGPSGYPQTKSPGFWTIVARCRWGMPMGYDDDRPGRSCFPIFHRKVSLLPVWKIWGVEKSPEKSDEKIGGKLNYICPFGVVV